MWAVLKILSHTHLETPRRERMRWDGMRIRVSAFWVPGLAKLPFKNKSRSYKNWRPNSLPTDFRSFIGTDRKSVSVPPALLVCWFETSAQNSCAARLKMHEAPDSNSFVTCVTCVKLRETAISKLMRCMPQIALNCCTRLYQKPRSVGILIRNERSKLMRCTCESAPTRQSQTYVYITYTTSNCIRMPYPSLCIACLKVQWAAVSKPLLLGSL